MSITHAYPQRIVAKTETTCDVIGCPAAATRGGIFRHTPRPERPIFPVYYYCDEHKDRLMQALDFWALPAPFDF